jgi:hypothetical protein
MPALRSLMRHDRKPAGALSRVAIPPPERLAPQFANCCGQVVLAEISDPTPRAFSTRWRRRVGFSVSGCAYREASYEDLNVQEMPYAGGDCAIWSSPGPAQGVKPAASGHESSLLVDQDLIFCRATPCGGLGGIVPPSCAFAQARTHFYSPIR